MRVFQEAKEKERKRRLKKWDEEDVRGSGPASRRRYGSDSDDDNRPSLNRRKNRFADDELNKSGNKSSRSYRSDDDSSKKGGLAKLSFRRSMEDISTKRSPMLNRRNNRSRTPSPDLYTDRKNFNSLSGRKSRSRSPSPPSRFGGRDSLNRSGKLAPLRNQRGMSNDYDSDKEPWHRNKLRSSGGYKRFDDSDDERTPRGSRRKVSPRDRDNSDEENKFPKRLTGSKTRFKSGSRDSDDEDDTYRNRSARGSGRYGRKDDSDSDNNAPPRVSFTTADPLSSARSNKGRSPRSSSPPIPTLRNGRSSSPPVPALRNARSSSPPVPALRNARDSGYELGPLSRRNLAPLAPIEPSAPPAGLSRFSPHSAISDPSVLELNQSFVKTKFDLKFRLEIRKMSLTADVVVFVINQFSSPKLKMRQIGVCCHFDTACIFVRSKDEGNRSIALTIRTLVIYECLAVMCSGVDILCSAARFCQSPQSISFQCEYLLIFQIDWKHFQAKY